MGMPAPSLHRLVLLLALLAAAPSAATRARASKPGPLHPPFYRGLPSPYPSSSSSSPHPTASRLQPPLQWRWWNPVLPKLPSFPDPWRSLLQPRPPTQPVHTPMGPGRGILRWKSPVHHDYLAAGLYYHNPENRIAAPSQARSSPIPRRFRPSRWRSSEKKNLLKILRRYRTSQNSRQNPRRLRNGRLHHNYYHHHHTAPREKNQNRHYRDDLRPPRRGNVHSGYTHLNNQGFEPRDVHVTLTVPSTLLEPILASLPLTKRQSDNTQTSPIPEVEIVGLRIQDTDATNTTVVLSLRDHRSNEDSDIKQGEEEEEEEGEEEGEDVPEEARKEDEDDEQETQQRTPLSRPKRGARRRLSYGMNARIRAQMLAHRLSISYRHVQPCSYKDRYYCMNGGTCVFVGALDIKTCRCPIGYTGVRCELIDQEYILSLLTDSIIFS